MGDQTNDDLRKQVIAQCRAVAHLATVLAGVTSDFATLFEGGHGTDILDMNGQRTAEQMEALGNMLNGMDAATEEDDWLAPIFKEAQRRWPSKVTR